MLSPYKIRWQNMSSLELDLWTEISFDSDEGEMETYLNREAIASETYNGAFKRVYGYKWSDVLTPKLTFVKQNYEDFTSEENRKILSWLTSSSTGGFLDVYKDDSEVISFCILGNFTTINQHKIANGRIIGYTVEFESVSPFAFSPLKIITKNVSDLENGKIIIDIKTDDSQSPVYPRITIRQNTNVVIEVDHEMFTFGDLLSGSDMVENTVYYYPRVDEYGEDDSRYYWMTSKGKFSDDSNTSEIITTSVSIKNVHTNDNGIIKTFNTIVKNNLAEEIVTLDGANKVVSSNRILGRVFGDDYDWKWLPLYDGVNELSFVGNCEVTIEYREPIKCGGF